MPADLYSVRWRPVTPSRVRFAIQTRDPYQPEQRFPQVGCRLGSKIDRPGEMLQKRRLASLGGSRKPGAKIQTAKRLPRRYCCCLCKIEHVYWCAPANQRFSEHWSSVAPGCAALRKQRQPAGCHQALQYRIMRPGQPLLLLPAAALAGIVGSVTLGLGQKSPLTSSIALSMARWTNEPIMASGGTMRAAITATARIASAPRQTY
jgi:hypothetical protein